MALSRRHYVQIAKAIDESTLSSDPTLIRKRILVEGLVEIMKIDNRNFSPDRFMDACEVTAVKNG